MPGKCGNKIAINEEFMVVSLPIIVQHVARKNGKVDAYVGTRLLKILNFSIE